MNRVKEKYQKEAIASLTKEFGYTNVMAVPRVQKVIVNMGLGEATANAKLVEVGADELARITGQKPTVRKSKKSISAFKLREGMPIGVAVTLRGARMFEFLDRFISVAAPRIRDFRGLKINGFDGGGNYNLGLKEQYIFPEVNVEKSDAPRGMNITFVTSSRDDNEA